MTGIHECCQCVTMLRPQHLSYVYYFYWHCIFSDAGSPRPFYFIQVPCVDSEVYEISTKPVRRSAYYPASTYLVLLSRYSLMAWSKYSQVSTAGPLHSIHLGRRL